VPTSGLLIQNGGFENGSASWQESSAGGYELVDTTRPHSGNDSAFFCGYENFDDSIGQDFTVPRSAGKLTISYWWDSETNSFGKSCDDTFTATQQGSNGQVITIIQQPCNIVATGSRLASMRRITDSHPLLYGKTGTTGASTAFLWMMCK
jgi:hypothetical protein